MRMSRKFLGGALAAATFVAIASPAAAITGGEPDYEGHPGVAMIVFYESATARFRCTATLVTPMILITAAHCTDGTIGQTFVTFATDVPSVPAATVPAEGYEVMAYNGTTVTGTAVTHPEYSGFTDFDNWNDVGVIVLDYPVYDRPLASLAPLNYLDAFGQPTLNQTIFTLVGYGTEIRKPDSGPQKPIPMSFPRIRRVAESPGQKLTPQILQMNGNINDTRGTGGTCFGDSGGPAYLNGYIVAVTSYGYTLNCRYLGGYQRIDIATVQTWLAPFLLIVPE